MRVRIFKLEKGGRRYIVQGKVKGRAFVDQATTEGGADRDEGRHQVLTRYFALRDGAEPT